MSKPAKRIISLCIVAGIVSATYLKPSRANAQLVPGVALSDQDPEAVLLVFITALQVCGPPQAYQLLSPSLFALLAAQTGNSGCSPLIQNLGPLQAIKELDSVDYPAGPVKVYCATHMFGAASWQIGVSRWTQRVEMLSVNPIPLPCPDRTTGPPVTNGNNSQLIKNSQQTTGVPPPPPPSKGCLMFPDLCKS